MLLTAGAKSARSERRYVEWEASPLGFGIDVVFGFCRKKGLQGGMHFGIDED